jgi:hypothetical protein
MVWVKDAVTLIAPPAVTPAEHPQAARSATGTLAPAQHAPQDASAPERIVWNTVTPSTLAKPVQVQSAEPAQPVGAAPQGASAQPFASAGEAAHSSGGRISPPGTQADLDEVKAISVQVNSWALAFYMIPALTGEQLHRVDRGTHASIEIAVINHLVAQLRARYPDSITWEPNRGGSPARLSMLVQDNDRVVDYLHQDVFGFRPLGR